MVISAIWMTTKSVSSIHSRRISTRPWVVKFPSIRNGSNRTLYCRGSKERGKRQSSYLTSGSTRLRALSAGTLTTTHRAQLMNIRNINVNHWAFIFILWPIQTHFQSTTHFHGLKLNGNCLRYSGRSYWVCSGWPQKASGCFFNILILLISTK